MKGTEEAERGRDLGFGGSNVSPGSSWTSFCTGCLGWRSPVVGAERGLGGLFALLRAAASCGCTKVPASASTGEAARGSGAAAPTAACSDVGVEAVRRDKLKADLGLADEKLCAEAGLESSAEGGREAKRMLPRSDTLGL
mmetsp:Transcript_33317/g.60395  ORF Transcript_33317/g.60395 Transcript_33317/m.60395 type:complete len:140 (-) Transcript_33317:1066-1485(-)